MHITLYTDCYEQEWLFIEYTGNNGRECVCVCVEGGGKPTTFETAATIAAIKSTPEYLYYYTLYIHNFIDMKSSACIMHDDHFTKFQHTIYIHLENVYHAIMLLVCHIVIAVYIFLYNALGYYKKEKKIVRLLR